MLPFFHDAGLALSTLKPPSGPFVMSASAMIPGKPPDMSMLKSQPGSCSVPSASVKYVYCRSLIARSITAASPTFAAA